MIDLTNLKTGAAAPTSTGVGSLVVRNRTALAPKTVGDSYDAATRTVYVFDCSGSMSAYVFRPSDVDKFKWDMRLVREEIQKVIDFVVSTAYRMGTRDYNMVAALLRAEGVLSAAAHLAWSYCTEFCERKNLPVVIADNSLLQLRVIEQGLNMGFFAYGAVEFDLSRQHEPITRLSLLTETAIAQIDERVEKYPNAEFEVLYFDHRVQRLVAKSLDGLKTAMREVQPNGGTEIRNALERALRAACKPAANIAVNHIIFGTDGEDWSGTTCGELFEEMVAKHVVLDYIYIKSSSGSGADVAKVMHDLCLKTGGKYVEVTTADDIESKLVEAAQRKCLPPAGA